MPSKNSPRNVRHPTRCRAGEFFRAGKNLGEGRILLGKIAKRSFRTALILVKIFFHTKCGKTASAEFLSCRKFSCCSSFLLSLYYKFLRSRLSFVIGGFSSFSSVVQNRGSFSLFFRVRGRRIA